MSKAQNDDWIKKKANYSMIAYDMGVNFEVTHAAQVYDNSWIQKELNGEVTREKLREMATEQWNVVRELQVKLKVIKPFGHSISFHALLDEKIIYVFTN